MFVKLALLACSLAVAAAVYNGPLAGGKPADLYPAGVSPQACPNFPHCSNPAVAANPHQAATQSWGQPAWQPQNQWNPPAQNNWNGGQWNNNNNWNSAPVPQYGNDVQDKLNRGEYVGDGDYHGEGLAEALAPGYEGQGNWNNGGNWNGGNNWNAGNNWNGGNNQWNGNPAQTHGVGQIPAGVDAHSCPNYPFCS